MSQAILKKTKLITREPNLMKMKIAFLQKSEASMYSGSSFVFIITTKVKIPMYKMITMKRIIKNFDHDLF